MGNATKAAEKLALENNVDLSTVEGTGKDGNILVSDIKAAIAAAEEASADSSQQDDSSSNAQRESAADKWARLVAEATEADAAAVLDGEHNGQRVVVTLSKGDRVIADVDEKGFVKFVYADTGRLGGLLAKRKGKLFKFLHDAAGREMSRRDSKPSLNELAQAASKTGEQKRESRKQRNAKLQAELDDRREQIVSAKDFELAERFGKGGRSLGDGIGVGETLILRKGERPIEATVAYSFDEHGEALLAAVGRRIRDDRELKKLLGDYLERDGNAARDEDGLVLTFVSWSAISERRVPQELHSVKIGAIKYAERKAEGERIREERRAEKAEAEAAEANTAETAEAVTEDVVVANEASVADEAERQEAAVEDVAETTNEENEVDTIGSDDSDGPAGDPKMQDLLAELKERGVGSKVR